MRPAVMGSQRFRQSEVLGEDELGALWRGTDLRSGAAVTLRVLDERLTSEPQSAQRVLARLQRVQWVASNPHLPRLLELRLAERPAVVVTEGSGRETLAAHVERVGALPVRRALQVIAAIADGLASAHADWVSHGALVPSSVLVADDVVAMVVDVGLGELLLDRAELRRLHASNLTDRRAADVLAVGLLFERLVAGGAEGPPPAELDAPRPWEREVPADVREVLRAALSPHRLRRPGMAELAAALAPALTSLPAREPAGPAETPHARPVGLALPAGPAPPRPDRSEAAARPEDSTASAATAPVASASVGGPAERVAVAGEAVSEPGRARRRRRRVLLAALVGCLVAIAGSVGVVVAMRALDDGGQAPGRSGAPSPSAVASETASVAPALGRATVPGVLGARVERATELIERAGLVVGSVTTVPGRAGVVVRTEPTQGEAVPAGTVVDLFVGNGAEA